MDELGVSYTQVRRRFPGDMGYFAMVKMNAFVSAVAKTAVPAVVFPVEDLIGKLERWPREVQYMAEAMYTISHDVDRYWERLDKRMHFSLNNTHNHPGSERLSELRSRRNVNSLLLQMPRELLLEITDHVDDDTKVTLAQTCRATRALYATYYQTSPALKFGVFSSGMERKKFLNGLARDRLDEWFCETCVQLHPIMAQDVPSSVCNWYGDDPLLRHQCAGHMENRDSWWMTRTTRAAIPEYVLKFRHVHLALKFAQHKRRIDRAREVENERQRARLQAAIDGREPPEEEEDVREEQELIRHMDPPADAFTAFHAYYLRRLLQPFTGRISVQSDRRNFGIKVRVAPRLVAKRACNGDGPLRYLLRTTYPASSRDGPNNLCISPYKGYYFRVFVCPHHELHYNGDGHARLATLDTGDPTMHVSHIRDAVSPSFLRRSNVVSEAGCRLRIYTELLTSCARCPTDIVRQGDRWHVYQDFGTDVVAPHDLRWRIFHLDPQSSAAQKPVWHPAGRILEMYTDDMQRKGEGVSLR